MAKKTKINPIPVPPKGGKTKKGKGC